MDARHAPLQLAPELLDRLAVAEHLCPVFQPLFDRHLRVMTYEALMRVVAADGTVMPLTAYIEQMETSGLISLADIGMAEQVGAVLKHVRLGSVAVNASLRTLEMRLPAYLSALRPIRERNVEVIVEITETAPVIDAGRLRGCIEALREQGFTVALDDAKADHAYGHPDLIRASAPDIVKIDGSFFHAAQHSPEQYRHLLAIVDATHSFGGVVVFEWVDTPKRLELAFEWGADWIQGFLFGRPKTLWPSALCRMAQQRPCGHAHCPISHDAARTLADQMPPGRCGTRPSIGARKTEASAGDSNSVKKGHTPPSMC